MEQNCMVMRRKEFGAVESPPEEVAKDIPPSMIDHAMRFQTLRFRHQRDNTVIGKSVMDVTKYTKSQLMNASYSAYRVTRDLCGDNSWGGKGVQLFVNHYIGSWEAYQRPNDYRHAEGKRDTWYYRANVSSAIGRAFYITDEIRPWLQGFVSYFGEERSQYLLDNVGVPYNASTALHVL
jgi:hypothetical protein